MSSHYYICYDPIDGVDFAEQLYGALHEHNQLPKPWLDTHYSFEAGDYQEFIGQKIRNSDGVIFIMTPEGVKSKVCKLEWLHGLMNLKPIIPVRFDTYSNLPFRLEPREPIDLGVNFDLGLEKLIRRLGWLRTSSGLKETIEFVISDANFALRSQSANKKILTERIKFCKTLSSSLSSETEIGSSYVDFQSKHTFISYSRKNIDTMRELKKILVKHGVRIWNDEHIKQGDANWKKEIASAIEQAGSVIALLSPDAKVSKWVGLELSYAEIHNIRVFPVLIQGDDANSVPIQLISTQRTTLELEQGTEKQMDEFGLVIKTYLQSLPKEDVSY